MKLPSRNILIIGSICFLSLATAVYMKVQPSLPQLGAMTIDLTLGQNAAARTALEVIRTKMNADTTGPNSQTSLTERLSRDFAINYAGLAQSGQLDTDAQAELIENLAKAYATSSSITLTLNDISTFSDRDTAKTKSFGNITAKTIVGYYQSLKTSPIDILAKAVDNKTATSTFASELAPISYSYRSMALELQKIPAPASQAANYLAVINGYIALADDIDNMQSYFSDPVRGFLGVNNYQTNLVKQIELLKNITNYFASNGILFTSTEEGRIWNSLIQ